MLSVRVHGIETNRPPTLVAGAQLEEMYADPRFFEGPTWDPAAGRLYFTAFGKNKEDTSILVLEAPGRARVWADKTEGINGTCLSRDGQLVGAQAFGHRILKYEFGLTGPRKVKTVLFDPRLNQPNDIIESAKGDLYFTDPDFAKRTQSGVYLLRKSGELVKLISEMPLPNGLKLSNDGKTLYVGDSHEKLWRAFPILANGITGPGKVFFDPPVDNRSDPDGMTIDELGNLYFSGRGGVWVVDPKGTALGLIPIPEFCSNATFGDKDGRSLYLTCDKKVYRIKTQVRGSRFVKPAAH